MNVTETNLDDLVLGCTASLAAGSGPKKMPASSVLSLAAYWLGERNRRRRRPCVQLVVKRIGGEMGDGGLGQRRWLVVNDEGLTGGAWTHLRPCL